jgi:hypothetical protein
MTQSATRVLESLLFWNASHYINTWKEKTEPSNELEPSNAVDGVSNIKVGVRQHPHYLIRFFNGVGIETIEMVEGHDVSTHGSCWIDSSVVD